MDAVLSGTHEPGTSHYELLRTFADDATLRRADDELERRGYLMHEFGDPVLVERAAGRAREKGSSPREVLRCSAAAEVEQPAASW